MVLSKNQKVTFIVLVILIIALPIAVYLAGQTQVFRPRAAVTPKNVELKLIPSVNTVNPGQEFNVKIDIDPKGASVSAARVRLNFSGQHLEIKGVQFSNYLPLSIFSPVISSGSLTITQIVENENSSKSTPGTIATVTFKALQASATAVNISIDQPFSRVAVWGRDDDALNAVFNTSIQIAPAPTVNIKANNVEGPIEIPHNTAATLSWTSVNATACTASGGWSGTKTIQSPTLGESTGNLTASKTFTITCTGAGGSATDSVVVNAAAAPPTVNIKANNVEGPIQVPYNTAATLSWSTTNATSCTASNGWSGTKPVQSPTSGETTGNLTVSKTFTITCTGPGGNATDNVVVNVGLPPPVVIIKANDSDGPITIGFNKAANLSWTITNAASCTTITASGDWTGTKTASGSQTTGNLGQTKTYTLSCSGAGGNATDSVIVNVGKRTGDLDGNTTVDIFDFTRFVSDFRDQNLEADFNKNNEVDIFDFNILLQNFDR